MGALPPFTSIKSLTFYIMTFNKHLTNCPDKSLHITKSNTAVHTVPTVKVPEALHIYHSVT
jgi:hypothetical protein